MNEDCLFCKIARKEIPSKIQYEDDEFLAFDDINPKAAVHILIIPKKHYESLNDFTEKDAEFLGRLFLVVKKLAQEKGIADGYKVVINNGKGSGQIIEHLHIHLLGGEFIGNLKEL